MPKKTAKVTPNGTKFGTTRAIAIYPGMPDVERRIASAPTPLQYAVFFKYFSAPNVSDADIQAWITEKNLSGEFDGLLVGMRDLNNPYGWGSNVSSTKYSKVGRGVTKQDRGAAFYSDSAPGELIQSRTGLCSAGFYAQARDGSTVLVTAGHCEDGGMLWDVDSDPYGRVLDVRYRPSIDNPEIVDVGGPGDHAVVHSTGGVTMVQGPDGLLPIRGLAKSRMLRKGSQVCRIGITSGLDCNLVLTNVSSVNRDLKEQRMPAIPRSVSKKWYLIRAMAPSTSMPVANGDSGGLVYAIHDEGAYIVGVTSFGAACRVNCGRDDSGPGYYSVLGAVKASVIVRDFKVKPLVAVPQ